MHSRNQPSPLMTIMDRGHHCPGWNQERSQNSEDSSGVPALHSQPTHASCPEQSGPRSVHASPWGSLVTVQSPDLPGQPLRRDSYPHNTAQPFLSCLSVPPVHCALWTVTNKYSYILDFFPECSLHFLALINVGFPSWYFFPCRCLSHPVKHWAQRWLPGSHCCPLTILRPLL